MVIDMLKRLNSSKVIALILVIATVFLLFIPVMAAEQSATVGNTLPENRVFYKLNTGSFSANHVDMAQGKDDVTTINFVCNIIKFGNEQIMYDTYMHDMWYSNYGIYRGEQ